MTDIDIRPVIVAAVAAEQERIANARVNQGQYSIADCAGRGTSHLDQWTRGYWQALTDLAHVIGYDPLAASADEPVIDMGYMSLPADIQQAIEAEAGSG